ncbi:MAG: inorganic diphosphatase, partial [Planctomycetota bacterium]
HFTDVGELPPHRLRALKQFLLDYKTLEKKQVNVDDLRPRGDAVRVIRSAIELYAKSFPA